jgi:PIN domain nuclease of toxin-antitoxin system
MSELVLDTHVLVWWLEANDKLPASVRTLLDNKELDLHLAAIVVAELVDLCIKGRTGLKLAPVLSVLRSDERFVMHDFTADMALGTAKYAALPNIHDRCIVAATAKLIESRGDVVLVTRDQAIRDSKFVPTMWD